MQVPMEDVITEYQRHVATLTADLMNHRAAVAVLEKRVVTLEAELENNRPD